MTTPPGNRDRLAASYDRLRSALAKIEKINHRRGLGSTTTAQIYDRAISTLDGLTATITGQPIIENHPKADQS
jgi:hypothetical protein